MGKNNRNPNLVCEKNQMNLQKKHSVGAGSFIYIGKPNCWHCPCVNEFIKQAVEIYHVSLKFLFGVKTKILQYICDIDMEFVT